MTTKYQTNTFFFFFMYFFIFSPPIPPCSKKQVVHTQQSGISAPLNSLIHHSEIELFYAKMAENHQPLVYGSTTE